MRALQDQHFEQRTIIADRHAPFLVVIGGVNLGMRSEAAGFVVNGLWHGPRLAQSGPAVTRRACATV